MRRNLVVASLVVLAVGAFAAFALAGVKHFHGPINKGGTIDFDAKFKHGKPKRAGHFDLGKMPVSCTGGDTTLIASTDNVVRVRKRKFHYDFTGGGSDAVGIVRGKFNRKGNEASGTFKAEHVDLGGGFNDCTTDGQRGWTAHK
jgi:hypothetical protein